MIRKQKGTISMKKKTVRVGMIGAGQIARLHCEGILKHSQGQVSAVADLNRNRAKALADHFDIGRVTTKWEDFLDDPNIDAVSIALPNFLHAPVSIACLNAGKHVLLDKPFALSYRDAHKVAAAARKVGKIFMLGMNQRFSNNAQTVKALIKRGTLGEIYHAKAYWLRISGAPTFGTWFCRKDMAGGGAMLDIGVHVLDLAMHLMDNWEPVSVVGATYTKFGNRGLGEGGWGMSDSKKKIFDVDDFATALIKFKNGATLQLDASWALLREANAHDVQLYGTEAGMSTFPPKFFRMGKKKGDYKTTEPKNVKIAYPHCNRMVNWIDVILGKDKPMCTVEESLTVQKVLDAVYKSSTTGKEISIRQQTKR